jgi:hypothetical protein
MVQRKRNKTRKHKNSKQHKTRRSIKGGSLDHDKMQKNLDYRHGYEEGTKEYRKYLRDLQSEYDALKRDFEAEQRYSYQMEEKNNNLEKGQEALVKEGQRMINKLRDKNKKLKEENKQLNKLIKQQKGIIKLNELSLKEVEKTHVEIGSNEFKDEMLKLIKENKFLKAGICEDYINNYAKLKRQFKSLQSK